MARDPKFNLSATDAKTLARLKRKYGAGVLAWAEQHVLPSVGGRPPSYERYLELANVANWFEERVAENRTDRSKSPVLDAELLLFELVATEEEQRESGAFFRFQKNWKKKRLEGKKYLDEIRRLYAKRKEYLARKKKRPR